MLTGVIPPPEKALAKSAWPSTISTPMSQRAFAPGATGLAREFNADQAKLNPAGGAIALGHPSAVRHAPEATMLKPPGGDRRPLRPANHV